MGGGGGGAEISPPPPPGGHVFSTNPNGLNNLGRGSAKEHFCKIILKSVHWFLTRRFLKFLVKNLFLAPVT